MRPRLQRLGQDTTGVKVVYALDKQDDTVRASMLGLKMHAAISGK